MALATSIGLVGHLHPPSLKGRRNPHYRATFLNVVLPGLMMVVLMSPVAEGDRLYDSIPIGILLIYDQSLIFFHAFTLIDVIEISGGITFTMWNSTV